MSINLRIEETTLAIMIAGLYTAYNSVNVYAIPYDVYLMIAKELIPYLENWDYDNITFEQWIEHNLLIYSLALVTLMLFIPFLYTYLPIVSASPGSLINAYTF